MPMSVPRTLPNYEVVPLRSESITVGIVQSKIKTIEPGNKQHIKDNLNHVLELIDRAQIGAGGPKKDLLVFHEYPLQGFSFEWTREQALKMAIDIPGEETEAIGKKAKQYNCYIHTGCYGKLKEWPGHFTNMGIIIGTTGEVIYKRWKLRNLSGMGFSTTVHDVLDKYVEMYGWDQVFPVARTDIGNFGIIPEIYEPEVGRAFAMRGTEIMIRYMTAGAGYWRNEPMSARGGGINSFLIDFQAVCMTNSMYGIFVNNSLSPEDPFYIGAGHSTIFDNDGRVMSEAISSNETVVEAVIPIAAYRKKHSIPKVPNELYMHLLGEYPAKFPPNAFAGYLPSSIADAVQHYRKSMRW